MRLRFPAVLFLALSACESWDDEPEVVLRSHPAPGAEAPAAMVESGQQPTRVRGVMTTPDRCHVLTADLTRNERDLRLWVLHEPGEGECPSGEVTVGYTAEIQGLKPGQYKLSIIHGRAGTWRGTEPVLVHPIVVPKS